MHKENFSHMNEELNVVSKSINRLTVALWVIAGVLVINLLLSIIPFLFPDFYMNQFSTVSKVEVPPSESSKMEPVAPEIFVPQKQFHELPIEEQIKEASLIAVAKYEPAPDGQMKAIITDILKKDPNVVSYYDVGDEHPSSSYYPKDRSSYGDGLVIFFTGSPATMRMSMSYEGDRIRSLGDMPLSLFKEKCNEK
jgi:hypothetical protein